MYSSLSRAPAVTKFLLELLGSMLLLGLLPTRQCRHPVSAGFPSHPASVSTPLDTLLVLQGAHQRRTPSQCSLVVSKPFGTEFVTARDVTIRVCHCQGCYNPALNPSGCVCNSLSLSQCCSLQLSRSTDVVNFPLQPPAEWARGSVSVELR